MQIDTRKTEKSEHPHRFVSSLQGVTGCTIIFRVGACISRVFKLYFDVKIDVQGAIVVHVYKTSISYYQPFPTSDTFRLKTTLISQPILAVHHLSHNNPHNAVFSSCFCSCSCFVRRCFPYGEACFLQPRC